MSSLLCRTYTVFSIVFYLYPSAHSGRNRLRYQQEPNSRLSDLEMRMRPRGQIGRLLFKVN